MRIEYPMRGAHYRHHRYREYEVEVISVQREPNDRSESIVTFFDLETGYKGKFPVSKFQAYFDRIPKRVVLDLGEAGGV